ASLRTGPGVRDPQLVLSLQKMLSDKEIERAAAAQKYTEEYPGVLPDLDEQVRDLRNRLNQAVEAVSDNARPSLETHAQLDMEHRQARVQLVYTEARLAAARRAVARTRVALERIPSKALAFARVQRELEVARQVAQAAQRAEAEARLVAVDAADSGVYVSADMGGTNRIPVSPNTARNLVLAGLVGAIISLGCVVLLEQGNRCLRAPRDLARLAGGPLVGQLPWLSLWELAAVRRAEEPPRALDAYNLAAARLSLILRDEAGDPQADKRCILITSAVAGEGKSLTAASLARSMARAGQIVALVDADLRRPAQNRLFGTAVPHGLADVIASAMSLDEAIVTTPVPGLSILHSGAAHHAPTELLSSPRVSEVIERLQTTADTVIIDAPACAVFADALLLARHADCIIQVVALGRVDADLVRNTMDVLRVAVDQRVYVFANYAPRDRSAACAPHFHRQADPPSSRNGGGRRRALPAPSGSEPA
ncbi:MAG TPA: polysaccharide biosynthesis tyrosine autokinase, partial [Chthonomonadales bacterium]|nr:polysaccharide biosynthesis tyrosine autokinase [Chthonomonadales bacterium]